MDTPAHHTSSDQSFVMRTFMQVCCSRNINVKPVSLRSTPCSHISLIMFEDVLGCRHLFGYSRHIEACCWMKCRRMILRRYLKNPKVNESLNPDSLRSSLHKVTECNQISIKVVRIQNYYFGYSRTSRIELSNLIDMHVDAGMLFKKYKM